MARKFWTISVDMTVKANSREQAIDILEDMLDELTYDGRPLYNATQIIDSVIEAEVPQWVREMEELEDK